MGARFSGEATAHSPAVARVASTSSTRRHGSQNGRQTGYRAEAGVPSKVGPLRWSSFSHQRRVVVARIQRRTRDERGVSLWPIVGTSLWIIRWATAPESRSLGVGSLSVLCGGAAPCMRPCGSEASVNPHHDSERARVIFSEITDAGSCTCRWYTP